MPSLWVKSTDKRKVLSGEIMKMYSGEDVRYIVELFLAQHFNFASVDLNEDLKESKKCTQNWTLDAIIVMIRTLLEIVFFQMEPREC